MSRASKGLLIALALLVASPAAWARRLDLSTLPPSVRDFVLETDARATERDISASEADEWLKRLRGLPQVQRAHMRASSASWHLGVDLVQKIGRVKIEGHRALSTSDIHTFLNLSSGQAYDMSTIIEGVERLRIGYREVGVLNPNIDLDTPPGREGEVDLNFKIDEGPQTFLGSWIVRSDNSGLNERFERLLRSYRGPYSEEKLRAARETMSSYLRNNLYLQAEIRPFETRFSADETRADITVQIDNPHAYIISFTGNKELGTSHLENDVLELKKFSTANPNVVSELTGKITQAYLARGFARVEVRPQESTSSTPFTRRLIFQIEEGPKVRIEKIEFTGRISRKQSEYRELFYAGATRLISGGHYNKEDLEAAVKNLTLELQNSGYLVSKIIATRTQFNRDKSSVVITINLDEGPLTQVAGIEFVGNEKIPGEELARQLQLRPGGPLKLNEIERSIQIVRSYYQERGFIEMKILNEKEDLVVYNEDNTRATLNFRIAEGPRVTVASIITDGNTFTREYVITNELDFAVGDILTPSKIEESIARLQRSGHFGTIEIKTLEENTAVDNRTVVVRVSERNPGVFTIGAGATNERGLTLRGYTGVGYRNLYGTGRGVSLRLEGNYNVTDIKFLESKVTVSYLEPYLANTRNRGRVNANRQKYVADYDAKKITEANQVTWTVERDFTSQVIGAWDAWSMATFNDSYLDNSKPASQLDIALTTLRLDLDYRDNPFNPSKGSFVRMSTDYSGPVLGNKNCDEFYRANASYTFYMGVPRFRTVWANSIRGGYVRSLGEGRNGGIPYDKVGYILGGRSTIRGYEAGTTDVFPNALDLGQPTDTYRMLTAATMGLFKSELRFPLWGEYLGGSIFYDGGSVMIQGIDFADNYRDSAGVGLHILTPVGPINLELAWKLDRREGESDSRFHLSVGSF